MAEAAVLVGVVAAAAQFIEIGCKVVLHASSLFSKFQDVPPRLQRAVEQVQLLVHLAELTSKKNMIQPLSVDSRQTLSLRISRFPLSWLESVWTKCAAQAHDLDELIRPMLQESENTRIQRVWRKFLTLGREEKINQILKEIESYKAMLTIWFGQECLGQIYQLKQDVVSMHGDIENFGKSTTQLYQKFRDSIPSDPPESTLRVMQSSHCQSTARHGQQVSCAIESRGAECPEIRQQLSLLTDEIQAVKLDIRRLSKGRAQKGQRQTLLHQKPDEPNYSHNQLGDQDDTKQSAGVNETEDPYVSKLSECRCRLIGWKTVFRFGDSKTLLQYCKAICEDCPMHQKRIHSSTTTLRHRGRIPFLACALEFVVQLQRGSGGPAIGISLRTEARVKVLPLFSFFRKLYDSHLQPKRNSRTQAASIKRQEYLISVARKLLLQAFHSGGASPDDVDGRGRTLLHLQVELSRRGDEAFLARMIQLLLTMGIKADVVDDEFYTAQQTVALKLASSEFPSASSSSIRDSVVNHKILDWTGCKWSSSMCASRILDCIHRWPESISDWGYPQICDIVLRRSRSDLELYMSRALQTKERTARQLTPLHFAAAANWPEGVEILIAHGADKYAEDSEGEFPLDIAIRVQSVPIVGLLLRGDCSPYVFRNKAFQRATLPSSFLNAAKSANEELQNIVVDALSRQQHQLPAIQPYHDLAVAGGKNVRLFAEKMFSAGFRNIEEYNEDGLTPLMSACCEGTMSMAAFFLQNGADPFGIHRDTDLRAGHFIKYESGQFWTSMVQSTRQGNDLRPDQEAKLLEAAFDIAGNVHSRCRCSPEGFDPVVAVFRANHGENFYVKKRSFENMISHLNSSEDNLIRQWRCLVRCEIFDRLKLTHTCIRYIPTVRKFPEEDRLEIEEEEEELYLQLEKLMNEYDEWQGEFDGNIVECVGIFFDRLDLILRPTQTSIRFGALRGEDEDGILGPGERREMPWISSRGERLCDHKEGGRESYILCPLFD